MDYENKYRELLARLQKAKENEEVNDERYCCVIDGIVPELKEDEDELTWLKNYISEEAYYLSMDIRDNEDRTKLKKLKRSLAWLKKQYKKELVNFDEAEKEKREFVSDGFIKCYANFQDFKEGETYWLEYIGDDNYNVRSDNLLGKTYHITPCQLYTIFKKQTWLEKQGESAEINPDEIIEECHQDNADHIIDIVTEHGKPSEWSKEDENKYSATEAIKEEKVDNANKAEPKFKVGDWVVKKSGKNFHNGSKTIQFTKTDENACQFGSIRRLYEDKIRHWTIADAQDGDVLVSSDGSIFIFAGVVDCACKYYVSLTTRNYVKINKEVKGGYWETSRAVHPATKEQCALLFQKMREEEYEWDSEKKKLKKIMESNETN